MSEKSPTFSPLRRTIIVVLSVLYIAGAAVGASNIIAHGQASTDAIEKILDLYNWKNEGAKTMGQFTQNHPILGMLFGGTVKEELKLPSADQASEALYGQVKQHMKMVREESFIAAWWSWALISFSAVYVVAMIATARSFMDRPVLFALNTVALTCFIIGIFAPAMVIWTAPDIPLESGTLNFVVQHQVRGIAAIIRDLLTNGHWIIGGFLLLFSIVTPLTKATLTYFVTACRSAELNMKIGQFLHTIGKWSMADVFVAAVLLALYALKYQEATKSIPCLGLYYFIGYCLFSLSTTELMVHSGVTNAHKRSKKQLGLNVIGGLVAGVICFMAASSLYTYDQYTKNKKHEIRALGEPSKLNNADLVLPAHK